MNQTKTHRATMIDVAKRAGVSLKTVSRVVNNERGVRTETAELVRDAIAELGYRRNDMASDLRAGRSAASIGLIIEDLSNPFYSVMARGVEQTIHDRSLFLITASSEENAAREKELLFELARRRVVGMIVVPTDLDHGFLQHELDLGLEVVFVDRPAKGLEADTVLLDNRGGASAAIEHLISLGHRRIGVVGHAEKVWTMRERIAGYRATLGKHTIDVDESLMKLGPVTPTEAAQATAELLDGPDPPTAFFGCNNRTTIGILWELRHRGLTADLAGFDDIETAELFNHRVALVSYDTAEVGRTGAGLLLERLDGRESPREVVIPTTLVHYGPGHRSGADPPTPANSSSSAK